VTESEAAFAAAVSLLGRLREARLCVDPDVTWLASGRPLASLNNVFAVALRGDPAAIDARIEAVQADVSDAGALPATWWIGPGSTPPDLAAHLRSRGLTEAEPEFGMVVDVDGLPPPAGHVEEVGEPGLDEWLGVMGRSYGWSDTRAIAAWSELYRDAFDDPEAPWWHVVVRDSGGAAVACASLFPAGETGFVTNVGTVPEARGAGHGTSATLAVLAIARRLGYRRASLTASVMAFTASKT
jgi:GNAT superfamily N-acetyltransferase